MIKTLEGAGWTQVRQKGSHRHFQHPIRRGTVTVPGNRNGELHPKTKASIMRQAGLR
jgi:predicted RNA binding protein YcfA (HicA-like mRNA interferase family)